MADICIFGDSITYGIWDEQGGWVQRVRSSIDQAYVAGRSEKYSIYNLGIPGDTAEDILKRVEIELSARMDLSSADNAVIFAVGMNDSHFMFREKRYKYTAAQFEENLRKLIGYARAYTSRIALVGLNPVDESKVNPLPWNNAKSYSNESVKKFNDVVEAVAKAENFFFADIWKHWMQMDYKTLLSDGLHPNASGHRRIAEKVNPFLVGTSEERITKSRVL